MPFSCAASSASAICRRDAQSFFDRHRSFFNTILQRRPLDQFHDEVIRTDIEQRADIGVIQSTR